MAGLALGAAATVLLSGCTSGPNTKHVEQQLAGLPHVADVAVLSGTSGLPTNTILTVYIYLYDVVPGDASADDLGRLLDDAFRITWLESDPQPNTAISVGFYDGAKPKQPNRAGEFTIAMGDIARSIGIDEARVPQTGNAVTLDVKTLRERYSEKASQP